MRTDNSFQAYTPYEKNGRHKNQVKVNYVVEFTGCIHIYEKVTEATTELFSLESSLF